MRDNVIKTQSILSTESATPASGTVHISDHARVGALSSSLILLTGRPFRVIQEHDQIVVKVGDTRTVMREFRSEYELILWFHRQIRDFCQDQIKWFKEHGPAFGANTNSEEEVDD